MSLFLNIGTDLMADGKRIAVVLVPITEQELVDGLPDGWFDRRQYYLRTKVRKYVGDNAGNVYDIVPTESGIQPATAKYVQRWPRTEQSAQWQAQAMARERAAEVQREAIKVKAHDPLRAALEPVRKAYANAPAPQRAQLLAGIVDYITRGKPYVG
jgi:hypothetical protein